MRIFFVRNSIFKFCSLFLFAWLILLLHSPVFAEQSVTLGWDPSSDPNASGYSIYYGMVTQEYTNKVSAGNGTTVTIGGLIEGETYYFAATTYDIFNQESGFSEEMPYTVPPKKIKPSMTKTFVVGQNIVFNAPAGSGQSTYNWTFDSDDIESATNTDLTLTNITTDDAGIYSVTMTDEAGSTTNIAFNLEVYLTASATLSKGVCIEGQYTFDLSGVPGFEYVMQVSTNLMDWDSVQTNVAPFTFTDFEAGQYSQRFYRALAIYDATANVEVNNVTANAVVAKPMATLTHMSYRSGQYSFIVSGASSYNYTVQASTNLIDWVSVQTNKAPFKFIDLNAAQFKRRFYRAF